MRLRSDVLYNFLPVGGGGGLQNALSFVSNLDSAEGADFVIRSGSPLIEAAKQKNAHIIEAPSNAVSRIWYERNAAVRFADKKGVFAIFGAPFIHSHKNFVNIGGFAVSNLLYPEIDFWGYCSRGEYLKRQLIDRYRKSFYINNDFWIFETESLQERAVHLFGFPAERTTVVKMAPSSLVAKDKIKEETKQSFLSRLPNWRFKLLFLNGPHPNKRIHLLPEIAAELRRNGCSEFVFVLTMDPHHSYTEKIFSIADSLGVRDAFCTVNAVKQADVASLIDCCDAMGTFSLLESFSNNFVEAWKMEKPLIVTDSDWARASCRESALYVKPEQAQNAAGIMKELIESSALRQKMVSKGKIILLEYPTSSQKNSLYLSAIDQAIKLGKLSAADRKRIHL